MFALLGAAVAAALGVVASWVTRPPWAEDHPGRVVVAIAGLATVGALVAVGLEAAVDRGDAPSTSAAAGAAFTRPTDGQEVRGRFLSVQGSVEDLPPTTELLCIFKDELPRYYINTAQVANGQWSAEVGIGPASIGRQKRSNLILATATQSAVDELRRLREANPDAYYDSGLPYLPSGIQSLAEITIVRTS